MKKMKTKRIRVVIADDHAVVRRGLLNILESVEIYVCALAKNGAQAITLVNQHQPDVLIVDVKMPELDGIEVVRKLKRAGTKSAILALSGYDNEGNVLAMLRAGATGFVLKDELPETLVIAVKTVAEGKPWISPCRPSDESHGQ
jgi:DNA-binding NarL/FixJ family response regulator